MYKPTKPFNIPFLVQGYFKNSDEEYYTLEAMDTYGGSFVKQLAVLYRLGDGTNKPKLLKTFKQYFDDYRKQAPEMQAKENKQEA